MTNKEKCSIVKGYDLIPDPGLGEFIEGYTTERDPFEKRALWLLLIPIIGWLVLFFLVQFYLVNKYIRPRESVYIYKHGILWVTKKLIGHDEEIAMRYDDIGGIRAYRIAQYYSLYFVIRLYAWTTIDMGIRGKDGSSLLKRSFSYKNKHEADDKYNALGFAMVSILSRWNEIALDRYNIELAEKGYMTFYTQNYASLPKNRKMVTVLIGRDFIKSEENYAGSNFKYKIENGALFIYPSEEDRNFSRKKEYFLINLSSMYDLHVFLMAASQLLGICDEE